MQAELESQPPQGDTPRSEFLDRIADMPLHDMHTVMFAYDTAQTAHYGQFRASGEPYFTHPRQTALILLDLGIRRPAIIAGALAHDIAEDTKILGDDIPDTIPYLQWRERMHERMVELGGEEVRNIDMLRWRKKGYYPSVVPEPKPGQESLLPIPFAETSANPALQ